MNVVQLTPDSPEIPLPTGFEAFYLLYPKHVEKKDTRRVWDRLSPADQDKALAAIVVWRGIWAKQGIELQYLCSPRRWLFGERWEDEPPQDVVNPQQTSASHVPFAPAKPPVRGEMPEAVKAALRKLTGRA